MVGIHAWRSGWVKAEIDPPFAFWQRAAFGMLELRGLQRNVTRSSRASFQRLGCVAELATVNGERLSSIANPI